MQTIRTDIQALNKQEPAPFSDGIIHNFDTYLRANNIYLKDEKEHFVAPIPLERVIGIDQMYGDDATWGDCLEGRWLKRLTHNLTDLNRNPDYYLSDAEMDGLSFNKVGENYFIRTGKHRTIIAKFLAHFNPEVFSGRSPFQQASVTEYFVDTEFTDLKRRFEEIAKKYPALSFTVQHTTSEGDTSFLMVRELDSSRNFAGFSRSQANEILSALENPSVMSKWKWWHSDYCPNDIYSFIPYSACLKNLFK